MADQRATQLENNWLRLGAESRLAQIRLELEAIFSAFPELRTGRNAAPTKSTRKRRAFSKKGRLAISEGMRQYWARRKATEAKAAKVASKS